MQLSASHFQLGAAVLAGARVGDRAAERLCHRLKPVADAEHGHVEVEQCGIELGRPFCIDARGPTGEYDRPRVACLDFLDAGGVRDDLREHPRLTNPPGDELRVLRAEVDDQHGTGSC